MRHIVSARGVRGGRPCIAGTRIGVDDIVIMHRRLGLSLEQVGGKYRLGPAEVHSAMAYYYDHRKEIDGLIAEDDAFVQCERLASISIVRTKTQGSARVAAPNRRGGRSKRRSA